MAGPGEFTPAPSSAAPAAGGGGWGRLGGGFWTSAAVPHFSMAPMLRSDSDVATALKGARPVYLEAGQPARELPVYARERLAHGHELTGPVIVEADQTTLFVPVDWRLQIDRFNNAMLHAL